MTVPTLQERVSAQRVDELVDQAQRLRAQDPQAAGALCRQARQMALGLDYQPGLARALMRLSSCAAGDEDPAELLSQSISLYQGLGDIAGESEALNLLANHQAERNDYASALEHYHRGLALRRQLGDRAGEAGALNNIGLVLRQTGQYAEALKYVFLSLEIAESARDGRAVAYAQSSIGTLLADVGDTVHAMQYHLRSLALARERADAGLECAVLVGMGSVLTQTGQAEEALAPLRRAVEIAQSGPDAGLQGRALLALGHAQLELGHGAEAEPLWLEALSLAHGSQARRLEAETLLALARLQLNAEASGEALELLALALQIADELRAEPVAAAVHDLLSQAHEQEGHYPAALYHLREFQACQQRINGQDVQRRIRALLSRAEVEKAQLDAEHQRLLNSDLAAERDAARLSDQQTQDLLAQLSRQTELLKQLAREDGLTGVANRRWLDAQLQRECERARRYRHPLTVAMIDLDHFKQVNDRCSHAVGDEVLRRTARILRDSCRSGDVLGRYGGEEFLLLLTETSLANAALLCEKLRARIEAHPWQEIHPDLGTVTVSIGLASHALDPQAEQVVHEADEQLYRAKRAGRNRVCYPGAGD